MADIPRAYKLNKEKRAVEGNGKFLYYFYDRKKLTSVALPEEQFDKLVEMDRGGVYKESKSYRKERDGMLRQNQWHDLTVRVFM